MLLPTAATLLLLSALGQALPGVPPGYSLHESKAYATRSLHKRRANVDPDAVIPVKVGLIHSGLDEGYERVMAVSDPTSPTYGKHLTVHEVDRIFAPAKASVDAVRTWLAEAADIDQESILVSNNGWLVVDLPVRAAERAFATRYYEHEDRDGKLRIGCDEYYVPSHLAHLIDYVTPGVKSSPPLKKRGLGVGGRRGHGPVAWTPPSSGLWRMPPAAQRLPPVLQDCARNITPTCIRALYGIPVARLKDSVNALGLFEEGDYYAQSDLNSFFTQYAPNVPNDTAPIPAFIDGAQAPVPVDDPSNTGYSDVGLDMAYSLIYPQQVVLYQTDDIPQISDRTQHGWLNTFLDALDGSYCNYTYDGLTGNSPGVDPTYPDPLPGGYTGQLQCGVYKPTRVIAVQYGEAEADVPVRYQRRQCNEFMKLALQGHSIIIASGVSGVAGYPGDGTDSGCLNGFGQTETIYNPDFISSCPWVTSVGGTRLYENQTVLDRESVMQVDHAGYNFSSAGGFSNRIAAPAYQKAAIATYFAKHDPGYPYYVANADASNVGVNGGLYNRAGRGIPDVSVNAFNFRAYSNGTNRHWFGPILSAPLFASVITLINEERTAIGKGPVGFINPVLYANPSVLNDITNGTNPGCGSPGFSAVSNWDPVTGLGTPNYPKMLKLFLSLP